MTEDDQKKEITAAIAVLDDKLRRLRKSREAMGQHNCTDEHPSVLMRLRARLLS